MTAPSRFIGADRDGREHRLAGPLDCIKPARAGRQVRPGEVDPLPIPPRGQLVEDAQAIQRLFIQT